MKYQTEGYVRTGSGSLPLYINESDVIKWRLALKTVF